MGSGEWRVVGFVDSDEVHFHIGGAGPLDEPPGKGDEAALAQDDGQAAFAGIALPKGVGGDHTHTPAGFEQAIRTAIKGSAQVRRAAIGLVGDLQPAAVFVAEIAADLEPAHEGRISQHYIEAVVGEWRVASGEWLGFGEWGVGSGEWSVRFTTRYSQLATRHSTRYSPLATR